MKGFTLIELLAVIVILAIIILISVPLVSNVIESTKKSALESSAKMLVDAAENAYAINKMNNENEEVTYTFTGGVQSVSPIGKDLLQFSGKAPEDGYLRLNTDGEIELRLKNDGLYASKEYSSSSVTIEEYVAQTLIPSITCPSTIVDSRDSKEYDIVKIGEQCWFAEDLDYNNGCMSNAWASGNACINQPVGYTGKSYQWNALMNGSTTESAQGLCPSGYHVPSDSEWKEMEMFLGMSQALADLEGDRGVEGKLLKSVSFGGTNTTGFSGLPSGYTNTSGSNTMKDQVAIYYTSTETGGIYAWSRYLVNGTTDYIQRYINSKSHGFSVRCVID